MEKRPDSALLLLRGIKYPEELSAEQYATWCLLLTQGMDKNYEEHESDSLISIAANYFSEKPDLKKKAKAFYYHGRVNQDLGQPKQALTDYLSALDVARMTDEYRLCGLICDNMGQIYRKQFMDKEIIPCFQQAYQYYVRACDSLGQVYALRNIGRTYAEIEPYFFDTAFVYYEQALALAKRIKHTTAQSSILNDMGEAYKRQGNYSLAIENIVQSIHLSSRQSGILLPKYSNLGEIYMKTGVYDSARYYIEASLESSNLVLKGNAYSRLAQLEVLLGNHRQACFYKDSFEVYKDSLNSQLKDAELKSIERKYHAEKIVLKMREKTLNQNISFLLIACVILTFFFLVILWYQRRQRVKDREIQEKEQEIRRFGELVGQHQNQIELHLATISDLKEKNEVLSQSEQDLEMNKCFIQENQALIMNLESRIAETESALSSASLLKDKVDHLRFLLLNQSKVYQGLEPYIGKMHRNRSDDRLCFSTSQWVDFLIIFNNVYNGLLNNLKEEYKLDHDDQVLFSLMKLSIIGGNIQIILNLNSPSLITRKKTKLATRLKIKLSDLDKFVKNRNI